MRPSCDQIRLAAYERWERRGRPLGSDQSDWFAAEGGLVRTMNYEVVAGDRLDSFPRRELGDRRRRLCRFCGQAAPRTTFSAPVPALPEHLGLSSRVAFDQCDDCLDLFREGIDTDFAAYLRFLRAGDVPPRIPIGAFKGLVRLALSLLPSDDLETYEDAIEWISNPDHDFDRNVFADLTCVLHRAGSTFPWSWAVLVRRTDDHEAWPYFLFFLGSNEFIFQIAVPLGQRDDDLDSRTIDLESIAPPAPFGIALEPSSRVVVTVASAVARRVRERDLAVVV